MYDAALLDNEHGQKINLNRDDTTGKILFVSNKSNPAEITARFKSTATTFALLNISIKYFTKSTTYI